MIIGLDVGGTHTDAVLMGNEGLIRSVKVPTRTEDLFETDIFDQACRRILAEDRLNSKPVYTVHELLDGFTVNPKKMLVLGLLRKKALARGANPDHLELETGEEAAFSMVRGFNTTGKNIRIKVQIKPGLIHRDSKVQG